MNKSWLVAGAVIGCLAGGTLGACGQSGVTGSGGGSSSSSGPSSSASTASSGAGGAGSGAGGASSSSSSGAGGGGNADAGCKSPSSLHPPKADGGTKTLFCPFSGADGGSDIYCDYAAEHCCEPKTGQASCDPSAMPCAAGDTDWKCADPSQCPQGQVCCGTGVLMKSPDPNCANTASAFSGTHCAASCAANEIVMCTADSQCSGKTCLPFRARGNQVGGCN